jgi:hypothetical protein
MESLKINEKNANEGEKVSNIEDFFQDFDKPDQG